MSYSGIGKKSNKDDRFYKIVEPRDNINPAFAVRLIKTKFTQAVVEEMARDWKDQASDLRTEFLGLLRAVSTSSTVQVTSDENEQVAVSFLVNRFVDRADSAALHSVADELLKPLSVGTVEGWETLIDDEIQEPDPAPLPPKNHLRLVR